MWEKIVNARDSCSSCEALVRCRTCLQNLQLVLHVISTLLAETRNMTAYLLFLNDLPLP